MATFVIGDIQGCFATFQKLLSRIRFSPPADRLWLVGDLVNRGPASLETLRWLVAHRDCIHAVLGNHDLHLLMRAEGVANEKPRDTLEPVLRASDAPMLLAWLRQVPLVHSEENRILVHAGLLPSWSPAELIHRATLAQAWLREDATGFLNALKHKETEDATLEAVRVMTRIRACSASGEMNPYAGAPEEVPEGFRPWFDWEHRQSTQAEIFFGHWAALGARRGPGWTATDSGCVWGRELSAFCLDDGAWFHEPCADVI